jgi:hypothetical protein
MNELERMAHAERYHEGHVSTILPCALELVTSFQSPRCSRALSSTEVIRARLFALCCLLGPVAFEAASILVRHDALVITRELRSICISSRCEVKATHHSPIWFSYAYRASPPIGRRSLQTRPNHKSDRVLTLTDRNRAESFTLQDNHWAHRSYTLIQSSLFIFFLLARSRLYCNAIFLIKRHIQKL